MKHPFLDMTIEQVREALAAEGVQPYRAEQLADWVYRKAITDPAQMTNVPAAPSRDCLTSSPAAWSLAPRAPTAR